MPIDLQHPTLVRGLVSRPHVSLGAMPEVVAWGVRAMLAPYRDRIALRDTHERCLGSDVLLLDPDARASRAEVELQATWRDDTTRLVYYSHVAITTATELPFRTGAGQLRGWLCMQRSAGELAAALECVHVGEVVIDGSGVNSFSDLPQASGLSDREVQVLSLIAGGLSNQEIVECMHLSINSIKSYIRSAYRKIGARSRSQAVLWCVAEDLQLPARACHLAGRYGSAKEAGGDYPITA